MTRAFVSRRRADEFDAMVSAPARGRDAATPYADLLEVVHALQAVPEVTARAEFVADLRSQLVVEAARQARPVVDDALRLRLTPKPSHGARERRAATLLGGFAIVAASGSMAMASQAALPGDVLYPVKRAIENAHTNLQSDDAAKAQTLIAHAEQRLQEAEQLTAEGADATTVAETLQDFTDQSNQAAGLALDDYAATGDQAAIGDLRSFAENSMDELTDLGDVVPPDARAALIAAAQSVQQADTAALQVCPTCGDGAVTELPEFATEPVALVDDLLSGRSTGESVLLPPGFIEKVEATANRQPDQPRRHEQQQGSGDAGTDVGDDTTSGTDVTSGGPTVDPNNVTGPLEDLGDKIKDGLNGNHPDQADDVDAVDAVTGAVDAVDGLVDGILGN